MMSANTVGDEGEGDLRGAAVHEMCGGVGAQ
jgi:hypothetical protein